jgi:two-component system sensor histidine kinase/response regulator
MVLFRRTTMMTKIVSDVGKRAMLADLAEGAGVTGWDVMVVEDLPATQKLLQTVLESAGHRVRIAANGLAAIPQYFDRRPDVILMDVQMPILDGLQTTAILRVFEAEAPQVPIIVVTAEDADGYRERCLAAGADEFVPKPFDTQQIPRLINELCARARHSHDGGPAATALVNRLQSVGPVLDFSASLRRLGGDKHLLQELIKFFLEDFPGLVRAGRTGLTKGDWPRVQRAAHSLKGLAANFTAEPAVQALQAVETSCSLENAETTAKLMRTADGEMIRLLSALAKEYSTLDDGQAA